MPRLEFVVGVMGVMKPALLLAGKAFDREEPSFKKSYSPLKCTRFAFW